MLHIFYHIGSNKIIKMEIILYFDFFHYNITIKQTYYNTLLDLCMFMTTVIKCLSINNDILNANMTLFEMTVMTS